MNDLKKRYFDWLYSKVSDRRYHYKSLCRELHDKEFVYVIPIDANRYEDGIDLRYHFGRDHGIHDAEICAKLDDRPCSIFEMMVALAIRCEEQIMHNPEVGNRTSEWFREMLISLGIDMMTDEVGVDQLYFDDVIERFIAREYEPNGRGGLFVVDNPRHDMREVEIWYQAMWYLTEMEGDQL